jgi:hypothetical protein
MAEAQSVRSAYSNLVGVLAKCFPSNCAHLKKLPKSENIVNDWQVLVNNPRVAQRDVELFHAPPLSSLGLSRLYKEGKLTPKSQVSIWGYVDLVLEALQPPPVDVPSPADMRLMRSVLGGRSDCGADGGITLGNLSSIVKDKLRDNPELGQMLGGFLDAKGGGAEDQSQQLNVLMGTLAQSLGGGEGQRQQLEALLGQAGGPGGNVLALAEHFQSNPDIQRLVAGLADKHGDFDAIGKFLKDKVAGNGELLSSLLENEGQFGDVASGVLELLPEELKAKFAAFGQEVTDQEGDVFTNALNLWTSHFNANDLQDVASAILPNLDKLIPKEQAAA